MRTRRVSVLPWAFLVRGTVGEVPTVAGAEIEMWSCAVMGQRRPVLYLADRGARSFIKFQGQRISASHELAGEDHKWVFGGNSVLLLPDGTAEYYQAGAKAGVFKCKAVSD